MYSLDLKDAYFAVPIAKEHCKYLCFLRSGRIFKFTCLLFGLCNAPCVFTKLLYPVMVYLRSEPTNYLLPGRHSGDAPDQNNNMPRSGTDVQLIGNTRIHNQPSHVTDHSSTADPILGISSGLKSNEVSREARQHSADVPEPDKTSMCFSLSTVPATKEDDSGSPSSSLSSNTII